MNPSGNYGLHKNEDCEPGESDASPAATRKVSIRFLGTGDNFGSGGRFQACIHVDMGEDLLNHRDEIELDMAEDDMELIL